MDLLQLTQAGFNNCLAISGTAFTNQHAIILKRYTKNIFVVKKPVMSYAMSGLIQLGQTGEIVIKGRGMVISRAVDVAQIITERLGKGKYSTKSIAIDTEILGEDDNKRNVSTIEIIIGTS